MTAIPSQSYTGYTLSPPVSIRDSLSERKSLRNSLSDSFAKYSIPAGVEGISKPKISYFKTPKMKYRIERGKTAFQTFSKMATTAASVGTRIEKAVKGFHKNAASTSPLATHLNSSFKILGLALLPFTIKEIYDKVKLFFNGEMTDKVDAVIDIGTNVEGLIGATSGLATILADYGAVTAESIGFVSQLGYVSAAFSVFSYAAHGKGLWDSYHFKKEINGLLNKDKKEPVTIEEFNALMKFFEDARPRKLSSNLRVDAKKFKMRMKETQEVTNKLFNGSIEEKQLAQENMDKTVKLIRKRIFRKQLKHAISLVATTVSVIGLIILFTCPYTAAAAWTLLAVAAAITLAKMIYDYVETRKFKKELGFQHIKPEDYYGSDEEQPVNVEMKTLFKKRVRFPVEDPMVEELKQALKKRRVIVDRESLQQ